MRRTHDCTACSNWLISHPSFSLKHSPSPIQGMLQGFISVLNPPDLTYVNQFLDRPDVELYAPLRSQSFFGG